MNAKNKRKDAEKAVVWMAYEMFNAIEYVKSIQTKWQRVDIFSADVASKDKDGKVTYIQVTAGQDSAISVRKKKLEKIPWHYSERVLLVQLKQRQEVINARRKEWFFKVWEFMPDVGGHRNWELWTDPVNIPRKWFKSYHSGE